MADTRMVLTMLGMESPTTNAHSAAWGGAGAQGRAQVAVSK